MTDQDKLSTAARRLYAAWTVQGRSPAYHMAQMMRLYREWPELALAIEDVVEEIFSSTLVSSETPLD